MAQRIKWLDFSKGITIFFVVFGHSLSTIYDTQNINPYFFITLMSIIFTFIMPCFFAISGYLYKSIDNIQDYKTMFCKKIISLGIPYLLFSIIYVIMQNFGGKNVNHPIGYQNLFCAYFLFVVYICFIFYIYYSWFIRFTAFK